MADRELPPLRVKLIGDDSSYKSMMDRASKQADDLAKQVAQVSRKATSGARGNGFFNQEEQALFNRMRLEEQAANIVEKLKFKQMRAQERLNQLADQQSARAQREAERIQRYQQRLAQVEENRQFRLMLLEEKAANKAAKNAERAAREAARAAKKEEDRVFRLMQLEEKRAIKAVRDADKAAKAEEKRIFTQMRLSEKFAKQEERSLFTQMQLQEKAANKAMRAQEKAAAQAARDAAKQAREIERQNRLRERGSGGGGFQGLTDRADLFLATRAVGNLGAIIREPMEIAMGWQDAEISLSAYLGSQEKAKQAVDSIKAFALESPYSTDQLLGDAKTMMAYGTSYEDTMKIMKNLGAVAGGNERKMGLLNYAMSQIISTTRLTGYELRQLTESGFNPLMVIAKDMTSTNEEAAKKFVELKKAMEDGRIGADMVQKALEIVNQKGGMFAGLLDKLNDSTRGLLNQLNELRKNMMAGFFVKAQSEIDRYLKVAVAYMKVLDAWLTKHPEAAKRIAQMAWSVIVLVGGMLMLKVVMLSAVLLFRLFIPMLRGAYFGMVLLTRGAMLAWTAMLTPVGAVIAAIAAVAAAIAVLAFGWTGVASGAKWAFDNALGFMWNFGENAQAIFTWLGEAWSQTWINMFAGMRLTWSDMTSWLADQMLTVQYMMGGLTAEELIAAQDALKAATTAEQNQMAAGVKGMPTLKLNTSLPAWEMPKYEDSNTPIADKENVDWNAMMGAGKGDKSGKGASSLDIAGYARGSADAEARARAFMAGIGKPISSTSDRKLSNEEKMAKFLRDIERNTRHPIKMDTATIV